MVKDYEEYNKDHWLDKLALGLHEESHCNFANFMKTIVSYWHLANSNRTTHRSSYSYQVLEHAQTTLRDDDEEKDSP